MAIAQAQYVDLLFKSLSGVAKTDLPGNKSASNEAIASPILNRGDLTWTESGLIPTTAAAVSGVVQAYLGTGRAVATADATAQAVGGVFPSWRTNLTNWVPTQFDTVNVSNTYRVRIYYGASGLSDPATSGGTQIFADGSGGTGEWYFDYASGVLNFIGGTIPAGMTGASVIYVYGYRYIGKVGVTNLPAISVSGTSTFFALNALNGEFTATTTSTNSTTGALVVSGGVGIGGSAFIGGNLTVSGTLNATISGSITTATNMAGGTAGQLHYQSEPGVTAFVSTGTAGQILVSGGTGSPIYTNTLTLTGTTSATSTTTGALIIAGGVGVGGDIWVGRSVDIVGTAASTGTVANNALYVAGGVGIGNSLLVTGPAIFQNDVVFAGTSTYVYSTQTIYTDNLINLHVPGGSTGTDHTWTVDDGKDIGLVFHYYKGADKEAFLGLDNASGYLEWFSEGTENLINGQYTGTILGIFKTGGIVLTNTTASNSTTTGALTVAGGVGIGGDLRVGGTIFGTVSGAGSSTTATNIAGGTPGQLIYQSSTGTTAFVGPGTAGQLLVSNGTSSPQYTNTTSIYVGNAVNAEKLLTARTITLAGDLDGNITFDGSTNVTLTATIQANSVALGTDTTGDYVATGATSGLGLSGSTSGESATFTVNSNATSNNTISTLVFRDASGNFSAGTVTANLSGNATSADKWSAARTITLNGDLGGTVTFDGTTNVILTATIQADSVALGSDTTGNYVASGATNGFGLTGSANSENATFTVGINSTSSNTISTVVYRDASGNFGANVITANLTGIASTSTSIAGGVTGSLPYQSTAGITVFLPLGLDGKILQVSTATNTPIWGDIDGGTF
jgi:cytoskeletal protein CcmA (bactofilin family)